MSITCTIFESIKSVIKNKSISTIVQQYNNYKERKKILDVFGNAIQEYIQKQSGENKAIGMINAFLSRPEVFDLIKQTMLIDETDEAIKRLVISFSNFSRGTFHDTFKYDDCIRYAVNQVLRINCNDQQRNILSINKKIDRYNIPSNNTHNPSTNQIIMTFSSEKDRVIPDDCFFDYNNAVEQLKTLWNANHIIQLLGPRGSGKKQIVSHLLFDNHYSLFIKSEHIKTKKSFIQELSTRCLSEQLVSADAITHFFAVNDRYTIILLDIEDIDKELKDYLFILPCKIILTSTKNILSDIPTLYHSLPTVEQGIQIYNKYQSIKAITTEVSQLDKEALSTIIEESGRIPECIRYIALYHLFVNENIDLSEFKASIKNEKKDNNSILSPTEYMKTILLPHIDITPQLKEVLTTISILPNKVITKKFLQYIIDYYNGSCTIQELITKGFGSIRKIDDTDVFIGSALICESEQYEDDDYLHLGELVFQYVNSFSALSDYTLKEVFEACEICESFYKMMYDKIPDTVFYIYLMKKAELYEFLGLHQLCINECNRILSMNDIYKQQKLVIRIKVTLSKALSEYGLYDQAEEIIRTIPNNQTDEEDRAQLDIVLATIDFGRKQFDKLILDIKTNLSDNPYDQISQYHQLATMNYQLGQLEEAKEYYELAESLIKELHYESTIIASMIYAAGSAIFLDIGSSEKSIELGEKSLRIATYNNKKVDSHILTSYNNLGNAYLESGKYQKAIDSYTYVLDNFDEVLSPSSPMIINSRINKEICLILNNRHYEAKSFDHLMIDLAKDKDNYHLGILSILSAGTIAAEKCEFEKIRKILDISQKWIDRFIDYPDRDMCYYWMCRLSLAESIGKSFCSNSKDGIKMYRSHWNLIQQGFFDNVDENHCQPLPKKLIPVYSVSKDDQKGNNEQGPSYLVFPSFPPPNTYMGYIMPDDSMTPDIQKGDLLWIKNQKEPVLGDTVIYCTTDKRKWLCMKFTTIAGQKTLVPNNKQYKAVIWGNQEHNHFCGIVIK